MPITSDYALISARALILFIRLHTKKADTAITRTINTMLMIKPVIASFFPLRFLSFFILEIAIIAKIRPSSGKRNAKIIESIE